MVGPSAITPCKSCAAATNGALRYCVSCGTDLGAPNCRAAGTAAARAALATRAERERHAAQTRGHETQLKAFEDNVRSGSCVVVTAPANVVRALLQDPRKAYVNYEALVGSGQRQPASQEDDQARTAAAGSLFGSYAREIVYGALSLSALGVSSYGCVHIRLKEIAVSARTSFSEENSYIVFRQAPDPSNRHQSPGNMSVWDNRHDLAVAKLGVKIAPGQSAQDWQALLLHTDGVHREADRFIEAHIFGPFDQHSIESIQVVTSATTDRHEKIDAKIVLELFAKRGTTAARLK